MNIRSVANALGGKIVGGNTVRCPGPGHSKHDDSLSVTLDPNAPDGILVHSFAGDDFRDCRDFVKGKIGIVSDSAPSNLPPSHRNDTRQSAQLKKQEFAKAIWQESRAIPGTPVEAYLIGRGLGIKKPPACGTNRASRELGIDKNDALRFHPSCPFKTARAECMVAKMSCAATNEFRGVHRTRLKPKDRAMLGPGKGAVVKLTPDDEVTDGLHICEGIETGIALLNMGLAPVWACLSAEGIISFPVLSGIECLTIFADNDANETGQGAARECGMRWLNAGKEVRAFTTPSPGTDFADWRIE